MKASTSRKRSPKVTTPATKGELTRQKILAAAAPIFNQRGFEGSSMNDLMEATGLKKGGIYRHFASKEELAAEAYDYIWTQVWQARIRDVEAIPNRVDRMKRMIDNFVHRRHVLPGGCPILNTAVDSDDGNPVLRERALKSLNEWIRLVHLVIREGVERKEIRPGVDVKHLTMILISSLEGGLMISRLERKNDALLAVQAHLNEYLEANVRA